MRNEMHMEVIGSYREDKPIRQLNSLKKKKVCKREGSYHCNIYRIKKKKNAVKQDILNLHSGVRRREK